MWKLQYCIQFNIVGQVFSSAFICGSDGIEGL